jgi:ribonuclease HI
MDEDLIDLILTRKVQKGGCENNTKKYERHVKIYTDGSKKDERAGYAVITTIRTYRRRVHQQINVFSTEQEAIIKAIWLMKGTQRDKVIITDSLSTLTAIKGNIHTKNPKTIKG